MDPTPLYHSTTVLLPLPLLQAECIKADKASSNDPFNLTTPFLIVPRPLKSNTESTPDIAVLNASPLL